MMKVTVDDGTFANFVSRAAPSQASGAAVVVLHDIYGVNDDIRLACAELADHGLSAIAPNLFWREEPGADVFSSNDVNSKRRLDLYSGYDLNRGIRDVAAIIRSVRQAEGAPAQIGVLGLGLGGLMAYLAAARLPIDAAVSYYGIRIEQHIDEANRVAVPTLIHLGEDDAFIPPAAQLKIKGALAANGNVDILSYAGCAHGFAAHAGSNYNAEATALAYERTYAFFQHHLR